MEYTPKTKDFFQNVFDVVRLIPKGRVTSYGAIAKYLGTGGSSRMVGWAMNASHGVKPKVPAHRVVNRNGMLSGKAHFETPTTMQELLAKEKIKVKLTEKELDLILALNNNNGLNKSFLLKSIWKHSLDLDTHAFETHLHRLRKKIYKYFKDDDFIIEKNSLYYLNH